MLVSPRPLLPLPPNFKRALSETSRARKRKTSQPRHPHQAGWLRHATKGRGEKPISVSRALLKVEDRELREGRTERKSSRMRPSRGVSACPLCGRTCRPPRPSSPLVQGGIELNPKAKRGFLTRTPPFSACWRGGPFRETRAGALGTCGWGSRSSFFPGCFVQEGRRAS